MDSDAVALVSKSVLLADWTESITFAVLIPGSP